VSFGQIWAPWRIGYLTDLSSQESKNSSDSTGGIPSCFLCQAVEGDARSHWVVAQFPRSFIVLNRFPYNNGHLLLAPLRHEGRLEQLTAEERIELIEVMARVIPRLEESLRADGFNIGLNLGHAAGAGVPGHLHWHIVPRWAGDTNFMPVVAGVKVIPQALEALWELLNRELTPVSDEFR